MKILLRTPIDPGTGYGNDGIGLTRALKSRGHDVRLSPTHVGVPLPRDIANLLTYELDAPFDLAIHHLEPANVSLSQSEKAASRRNLFWSMWEWESIDVQEWAENFSANLYHFDHIAAYDLGTYGAFLPYAGEERMKIVQGGYEAEQWTKPPSEGRSERSTFVFGMNGQLSVRKGVYGAYSAFQSLCEAHPEVDFQLILKSTIPVFPPSMELPENVKVYLEKWNVSQLRDFYHYIDCLLCPSWGEGKNLPALEALTCGTPVVLSDIPAHRQWASSNEVTFVPTITKELLPGHVGGYVPPEPLADAMWSQYTQKAAEVRKAHSAARMVASAMDWSKCVERLSLQFGLML